MIFFVTQNKNNVIINRKRRLIRKNKVKTILNEQYKHEIFFQTI